MFRRRAFAAVVVLVLVVATGAAYEQVMRFQAHQRFAAPGRLVDVGGGRRLQLDCRGSGSPTVVLESGLDNLGSLAWARVHDSLATTTRVCAYSRPGIMWSDAVDGPFDSRALAHNLHTALVTSGETSPWVMVGHSIGGPYVTRFTSEFDAEVAGLVLVDATHPDQFARFADAAGKSVLPSPAIFRVGAALAWTGLVRLLPAEKSPPSWPMETDRVTPAFLPTTVNEMRREIEAIPATLSNVRDVRSFGARPLVVLSPMLGQDSTSLRANGISAAQGRAIHAVSQTLKLEQATWSSRGRVEMVPGASHYVQFDRPDVVIRVVREVVADVRRAQTP